MYYKGLTWTPRRHDGGVVQYALWAPRYEAIRADFGYPFAAEEHAARTLERLLPPAARQGGEERVAARLLGRDVVVVGLAPGAGPPPVWRLNPSDRPLAIVAADGAARVCLGAGLVPAVVATDLDGPVEAEVEANGRGALAVVHAHGDNVAALERWVPEFPGELAGSWAGPPRPALLNPGGFTDGDRAAYLADAAGVRRILLWGFDLSTAEEADDTARAVKLRKLAWASRLLSELSASRAPPLELWRRDGSVVQFGSAERSTR